MTVAEDGTYSGGNSYNQQYQAKNLEECETSQMMNGPIGFITVIIVSGGMKLWFILNIRDWRDALRDKKPAGAAEAAGA